MAGFIEKNLNPGEKVIYRAEVHWFIYVESFLWLFMAVAIALFGKFALHMKDTFLLMVAGIIILIAAKKFIDAFLHKYFTEMAITNRRVIAKFGFIARDVIELPLERIESVIIDQSVIERITDAGSVAVRGTGSAMAPVRFIDKPIEFRNKLNEAIAVANKETNS